MKRGNAERLKRRLIECAILCHSNTAFQGTLAFIRAARNGLVGAASVISTGCRPSRTASTTSGAAQQATNVGRVNLLPRGDFFNGAMNPGLKELAPAECAGDCLDQRVVDSQPIWRSAGSGWNIRPPRDGSGVWTRRTRHVKC